LLTDFLDRWQATVAWFQASEELLDARHDGTSTEVCWDRGGLPGELAGLVEVSLLGVGHRHVDARDRRFIERLGRLIELQCLFGCGQRCIGLAKADVAGAS
jgi:hypothetical protein